MTRIGRYEIERELGRGQMGVVYLARDPRLERRVALKVCMLPDTMSDEERARAEARFMNEARAAAALAHPSIVTVHDVARDPDTKLPFIAMEQVAGTTLDKLLEQRGRLPLEEAAEIVSALAGGLGAAHAASIVHRDVKPANVLVADADGAVKLADFGIARRSEAKLTKPGVSLGSPAYMSPEQARQRPLDARSDLFSLAVIFYELLTGERPFTGDDAVAVMYSIVHEAPRPVTERVPGLPAAVDAFFERAMAKDPAERFEDAEAFRAGLEAAVGGGLAASGPVAVSPAASPSSDAPAAPAAGGETVAVPAAATVAVPSNATVAVAPSETVAVPSSATVAVAPAQTMPAAGGETLPTAPPDGTGAAAPRTRLRWIHVAAALGLLLVFALWLGGSPREAASAFQAEPARLELSARSGIHAGTLAIYVDDEKVFERELSVPRRRGLLKRVVKRETQQIEAFIDVAPGEHEIVAEVHDARKNETYRDTVVLDLDPADRRRLDVVAGRLIGSPLTLTVR